MRTIFFDAPTARQSMPHRLGRPTAEMKIFQNIFSSHFRREQRMPPGVYFLAVIMQCQHPLAKCEPDQVEPPGIHFQYSVELVNAAISLHREVLLQTDRFTQRRWRQLQPKTRRLMSRPRTTANY